MTSFIHTKDMTTTRREFFRCLHIALDNIPHTIDGNNIKVDNNGKVITLDISPLPPRELSKTLVMERWHLTIEFVNHDDSERTIFLKKFDRAFHRGGG